MRYLFLTLLLLLPGVAMADVAGQDTPTKAPLNRSIFRFALMAGDELLGGGTAFLSDRGLITCHHCVEPIGKPLVQVTKTDSTPQGLEAAVLTIWAQVMDCHGVARRVEGWTRVQRADIVVLDCGELPQEWVPLKWAPALPEPWKPVYAYGYYGASGWSRLDYALLSKGAGWTEGVEVQYDKDGLVEMYLRHSAPIYRGFSGGPLLNYEGEVVAVNAWVGGRGTYATSGSVIWPSEPEPAPEPEEEPAPAPKAVPPCTKPGG